jgi:hypothetical protein
MVNMNASTSSPQEALPKRHVQQLVPPASLHTHSTLDRVDYSDCFLGACGNALDRTAEQWLRTMVEDTPLSRRLSLLGGWTLLGLRLRSPWSRRSVLGWEIRRDEPNAVLVGVKGRFGIAGELFLERQPDALQFSTFVQLSNPVARAVWSAVTPGHCDVVQHLLTAAIRRNP